MTVSVFFNIFIVLLVAGFSALTAKGSFDALNKKRGAVTAYIYFWLFTALLWLFVAARLFAAYAGLLELDHILFLVGQVLVALSFVAASIYFSWRFFLRNDAAYITGIFYAIGGSVFLWLVIARGVTGPVINAWGTKYIPPPQASALFSVLLALVVLVALYDVLASIIRKVIGKHVHLSAVLLSVSLVVYAIAAYFDEVAVEAGWQLMLVRSIYIIAVAIAYVGIVDFQKETIHSIVNINEQER